MSSSKTEKTWAERSKKRAVGLLAFVGVLWLILLADTLTPGLAFANFGIMPRDPNALSGVLFAPFLHGDFGHLLGNSFPLIVLGWLMLARGAREFIVGTAAVVFLGGMGVWLLGRPNTVHIGASLIVFGWLGYLMSAGWHDRKAKSFLVALVVTIVYAGPVLSLVTFNTAISWEAHLYGFLAGAMAARALLGKQIPKQPASPSRR